MVDIMDDNDTLLFVRRLYDESTNINDEPEQKEVGAITADPSIPNMSSSGAPRLFLDLPIEVRFTIYEYCLLPDNLHNRHHRTRPSNPTRKLLVNSLNMLSLKLTCRVIHKEFSRVFQYNQLSILEQRYPSHLMYYRHVNSDERHGRASFDDHVTNLLLQYYPGLCGALRTIKNIRTRWVNFHIIGEDADLIPFIPWGIAEQNQFGWTKLEMFVNGHMENDVDILHMTEGQRLWRAVEEIVFRHADLEKYIWLGMNNGLMTRVVVRIEDRLRGRIACKVLLQDGGIMVLTNHTKLTHGTILRIFKRVIQNSYNDMEAQA